MCHAKMGQLKRTSIQNVTLNGFESLFCQHTWRETDPDCRHGSCGPPAGGQVGPWVVFWQLLRKPHSRNRSLAETRAAALSGKVCQVLCLTDDHFASRAQPPLQNMNHPIFRNHFQPVLLALPSYGDPFLFNFCLSPRKKERRR